MNELIEKLQYAKKSRSLASWTWKRERWLSRAILLGWWSGTLATWNWEIFSKLSQEIKDEIAAGYPRKALYAETSGDELFFFKDIEMTHHGKLWICELTHTLSKFILLFLGLKYKVGSYNSYLVIK